MSESGVETFLMNSPTDISYLNGFNEGGAERFLAFCVHQDGRTRLICPALSENQARRSGIEDIRPWTDGQDPMVHFEQLCRDWELDGRKVAVDSEMTALHVLPIIKRLPNSTFVPGGVLMAELMRCKDDDELANLYTAGRYADEAFEEVKGKIKPGMSEKEVAMQLVNAMQDRGGIVSFCIVAAGANGAEPHHHTDDTVIQEGDVVIMDFWL